MIRHALNTHTIFIVAKWVHSLLSPMSSSQSPHINISVLHTHMSVYLKQQQKMEILHIDNRVSILALHCRYHRPVHPPQG